MAPPALVTLMLPLEVAPLPLFTTTEPPTPVLEAPA
jgi:hypothetical protein